MFNLFRKPKTPIMNQDELIKQALDVDHLSDLVDLRSRTLLLQIYKVEEVTRGGIIMPSSVIDSSKFDNRIGRVLSIGPHSYDDIDYYPSGPLCAVGEWVVYWRHDASLLTINKIDCAILPANKVMFATKMPELIDTSYHVGK
jgi:co-chaperonin GroES (HSP10)